MATINGREVNQVIFNGQEVFVLVNKSEVQWVKPNYEQSFTVSGTTEYNTDGSGRFPSFHQLYVGTEIVQATISAGHIATMSQGLLTYTLYSASPHQNVSAGITLKKAPILDAPYFDITTEPSTTNDGDILYDMTIVVDALAVGGDGTLHYRVCGGDEDISDLSWITKKVSTQRWGIGTTTFSTGLKIEAYVTKTGYRQSPIASTEFSADGTEETTE